MTSDPGGDAVDRSPRHTSDVIVVLGAALAPDGSLGPALAERVRAGAAAFSEGAAPLVLMTGVHEAEKMRDRAVALGVPRECILVEPHARTTRENAVFCSELMRQHGLRRAVVVTQAYHRLRAVAAFRRLGVDAHAYRFRGRQRVKQVVRELVALVAYKARGWI
jgi:uncharacterized SAM-binding protein YcdF (DUF218 family)